MHALFRRFLLAALLLAGVAAQSRAVAQQTPPSFGPAGTDFYRATAQVQFQLGILKAQTVNLTGSILYKRADPGDANNNGKRDTRAQVLTMDLRGSAPEIGAIQLVVRPDKASSGLLEARAARADYPATAALDVYLMVRTKYGPLVAEQPVKLTGTLPGTPVATPALNASLAMAGRTGILLFIPTPGGPLAVGQLSRFSVKTTEAIPNPPPIAGITTFPTQASLEVDLVNDVWETRRETVRFTGSTTIKHSDPLDRDGNGVWEIPTEIVAMQLVSDTNRIGGVPLSITIDPRPGANAEFASLGRIDPRAGGANFPASSYFDVFLHVHAPSGLVTRNEEKLRMEAAGGIDRFPPGGRPYVMPVRLELHDPAGEYAGQTVALTLLFGEPAPGSTSMAQLSAATDSYTAAVAEVELELPDFGPAPVRLTGPMTIQRTGGAVGSGQPRIGATITALNLNGTLRDDDGSEVPVQLLVDVASLPGTISPGLLVQMRSDVALPATVAFSLVPELRVGSGAEQRRYWVAAGGVRLVGVFQALPGTAPLCPVVTGEFTETVTLDLLDSNGAHVGAITWGCLFPR
jgi:hypothetical protein